MFRKVRKSEFERIKDKEQKVKVNYIKFYIKNIIKTNNDDVLNKLREACRDLYIFGEIRGNNNENNN